MQVLIELGLEVWEGCCHTTHQLSNSHSHQGCSIILESSGRTGGWGCHWYLIFRIEVGNGMGGKGLSQNNPFSGEGFKLNLISLLP